MPFRSYDAVFFDFDGTLADSYDAIAESVNHIRALRGHGPLTTPEVKVHVGRGPDYLLRNTVPGTDLAVDYARYREHHPKIMADKTWLLPGAAEALAAIRQAGKKIALCSNKPRLFSNQLLAKLAIADHFDLVVGPEDVPRPKPAPDMIHRAVEHLNVPRDQVLYVGDMVVDIETARAAGVTVWIVPTGSDDLPTLKAGKPDRMLESLRDLFTI